MGAMLRFKQETGKEVTDIEAGSLTELCTFLGCCAVSACKSDGVEFGLSLMDFVDRIGPDEIQEWNDRQDADYKDDWARMRMLAAIVIQPHLKKKITPQKLLPFPWESATEKPKGKAPRLTAAESLKRFEKLAKRAKA